MSFRWFASLWFIGAGLALCAVALNYFVSDEIDGPILAAALLSLPAGAAIWRRGSARNRVKR